MSPVSTEEAPEAGSLLTPDTEEIMQSPSEPATASTTAVAAPDTSPDAPEGEDAPPPANNPAGAATAAAAPAAQDDVTSS